MLPYHEIKCLINIVCSTFMEAPVACAVMPSRWNQFMLTGRCCNSLTTNVWNMHVWFTCNCCFSPIIIIKKIRLYTTECTCSMPNCNFFGMQQPFMQVAWTMTVNLAWQVEISFIWKTITCSWNSGYHADVQKFLRKPFYLVTKYWLGNCWTIWISYRWKFRFWWNIQHPFLSEMLGAITWQWARSFGQTRTAFLTCSMSSGVWTAHSLPLGLLIYTEPLSQNFCTQLKIMLWNGTAPLSQIQKYHCVFTTNSFGNHFHNQMHCITDHCSMVTKWHEPLYPEHIVVSPPLKQIQRKQPMKTTNELKNKTTTARTWAMNSILISVLSLIPENEEITVNMSYYSVCMIKVLCIIK